MDIAGILRNLLKGSGVSGKVMKNYSAENMAKLAKSSADDIARDQGNLIATHQLWSDKLQKASDLGGFVQPSMAVVDPSKRSNFLPGTGFGDIVMVANRDTINPAVSKARTVIGDRDIYSPRFPREEYSPNMDELTDMIKGTTNSRQFALHNLGLDDEPKYSYLMQELYKEKNGLSGLGSQDLREMPDFVQFADDAFNKLRGDKQYVYFTGSGAKKTVPATAENANKIMNKEGAVGTEKGWQTPYTAIYHQNTKRFNNLDSLYKNKYRLIDNETGKTSETVYRQRMSDVVADLEKHLGRDGDTFDDTVANYVADLASNADASWGSYMNVPDNIMSKIDELKALYKEVPVSYFEAKPRRVVGGNEFYGAYVPESAGDDIYKYLNDLGVNNITKYADDADLDRQLYELARSGERGKSPYVLGFGGALGGGSILNALMGGGADQEYA